jgi:DNA-binding transcriptional LysR family regulator
MRQIEAFRAVILTGSMTGAGEMLNISQPAVSRLIRDLERDLGLTLFKRAGARIAPNEEALLLNREVERMFIGNEKIRETAAAIRGSQHWGAAGCRHAELGHRLPVIPGRRFLDEHPNASASLHEDSSCEHHRPGVAPQYDIGLAYAPTPHPGIEVRPLPPTEAVCIVPTGHPLARQEEIHVRDLEATTSSGSGQAALCGTTSSR